MSQYCYSKGRQCTITTISQSSRMCDLVSDNYTLLSVITRYGISLGTGEKTLAQVCEENQLDLNTLLLLLNCSQMEELNLSKDQLSSIDLECLLNFLYRSHAYFLDYRLPLIRQRLLSAISNCPAEVAFVIRRFFDEYVEEVRKHMSYEEKTVFPYARKLRRGERDDHYNIGIYHKRHDQIEMKITELKNLLIRYYPAPSSYELTSVLHDIFICEEDLATHNKIEDFVFTPYIEALEQERL